MPPRHLMRSADLMLGPGGKAIVPLSEGAVLGDAINRLQRIVHRTGDAELRVVISQLDVLRRQVAEGYHRNPMMMVLGNPPFTVARKYGDLRGPIRLVGEISGEAHAILYKHKDDRKLYEHEFGHPTALLAIERAGRHDVLITSPDGSPIWQDF